MALHYFCRHCGMSLGTIDEKMIGSEQLGFHLLNEEERQEMISYQSTGDIHVKSICHDCHEALHRNPDFHNIDYLIQ
ncbi:anti-sigma-F factor Fin family protein [Peribacillus tepidiphilus]|uniref:anti-sigma-F factor Fin family protein n=1 Tax=Peribacillus tepidiphilus TaxID=2652445 RepID=UPI001292332C|nr:anti-sigma-F factor Fin family protein [Peribacillus tepidiphilus]